MTRAYALIDTRGQLSAREWGTQEPSEQIIRESYGGTDWNRKHKENARARRAKGLQGPKFVRRKWSGADPDAAQS